MIDDICGKHTRGHIIICRMIVVFMDIEHVTLTLVVSYSLKKHWHTLWKVFESPWIESLSEVKKIKLTFSF